MIDALVFDAYGTLFDVHSIAAACEQLWPAHGPRLSTLWRAKQLEYTWLRSLMRRYVDFEHVTRDALAFACAALDLPLAPADADGLLLAYRALTPFADVRPTLAALRPRRLAILSNGSPAMLEPLVAHAGLDLDAILSVDALRIYKPAPEVYGLAVERLGVPAARVGFVSANGWDALGAKAFGFQVFWINRGGAAADRLGVEPDHVLGSVGELVGAV